MSDEPQVGVIGANIILKCWEYNSSKQKVVVNITGATGIKVRFRRPNGTTFEVDGVIHSAEDGELKFVTLEGTLDVHGDWEVQAYFTLNAWTGASSVARFKVAKGITITA